MGKDEKQKRPGHFLVWRPSPRSGCCSLPSKVRSFGLVCGRRHRGLATRPCVRTCWARVGAFESQQQLLFSLSPLFALRLSVTHLNKSERLRRREKKKVLKIWEAKRENLRREDQREVKPSGFWSFMQLKQAENSTKSSAFAQISVMFNWGRFRPPAVLWDTWFSWTLEKSATKTKVLL